jgi:hypothetical protein
MLHPLIAQTRRHFFQDCRIGLGSMALGSMLASDGLLHANETAAERRRDAAHPLAPAPGHFPARAKHVIFLFMAGGPSQFELFEPKPKLQELHGQVIPPSYVANKRFAFIKQDAKLLGTNRRFGQHGESGQVLSECLPQLATVADDLTMLRAVKTDVFNHGPAKVFVNTGSARFGRPSMGSWVTYGIGSECNSLPGFVVLQSGPRGPRGGSANWSSGFLPTTYQGVPFRGSGAPILNLQSPSGIDAHRQREFIAAVNDLNGMRLAETGDGEIATRIAAYEMAYRMQSSAPDLIDLADETQETLDLYGATPGKGSFANNCLLARRLVQRGVRFIQLYHTDWDHHGNKGTELNDSLDSICLETDRPAAALIKDLKRLGLLEDTLIVWGGEFGRTPQGEPREMLGRDHHIEAYTMWMAGAGLKPGYSHGATDELGYYGVEDQVHVHDVQATILHLLGLDHLRLTYRFQGRDFRLTDVFGNVIEKILA